MNYLLFIVCLLLGFMIYRLDRYVKEKNRIFNLDYQYRTVLYPVFSRDEIIKKQNDLKFKKSLYEKSNLAFDSLYSKDELKELSIEESQKIINAAKNNIASSFDYEAIKSEVYFMIEGNLSVLNGLKKINDVENDFYDKFVKLDVVLSRVEEIDNAVMEWKKSIGLK